jgi:hypothetical protein
MEQPDKYAVVFYQNEVGIREYGHGFTLPECQRKIRDYYQRLSDDVDKMSLDDFKKEFLIKDRYRTR